MKNLFALNLILAAMTLACTTIEAQTSGGIPPGGHRGAVNVLRYDGDTLLSAGEDGFVERWNLAGRRAVERFQLSSFPIIKMELRPGKKQLCVVESDGMGLFRISAWEYAAAYGSGFRRLFSLRFRDPVTCLAYSAAGSFIVAARTGRTGLVLLHPETGEVLQSPDGISGGVSLAATGRSERNMMVFSGGTLSYWDLSSGNETGRFETGLNLEQPIIFGDNRYIAAFEAVSKNPDLIVLDAATGAVLARESGMVKGILVPERHDSRDFFCISGGFPTLNRFRAGSSGGLEILTRRELPSAGRFTGAVFAANVMALGCSTGEVWVSPDSGMAYRLETRVRQPVAGVSVSGGTIAFSGGGIYGYLPLDYTAMVPGQTLKLLDTGPCTRIAGGGNGRFLFWQDKTIEAAPVIREQGKADVTPPGIAPRRPLIAASMRDGAILTLDTAGDLSVNAVDSGRQVFNFSSAGAMDVSFAGADTLILGRSAVSGNAPFLFINYRTGETVPVLYKAAVGCKTFFAGDDRGGGSDKGVYGAVVAMDSAGGPKTSIVTLNPDKASQARTLVEYEGEDITFSMAEAGGNLASTLGGDGAAIYGGTGMTVFERRGGLPVSLSGGGGCFVAADSDGCITWNDAATGRLLAEFSLYAASWTLKDSAGRVVEGKVTHSTE